MGTSINNNDDNINNNSLISGVSSMVEYLIPSNTNNDDEDDDDDIYDDEQSKIDIKDNTKILYVPVLDELCDKMSNLNFYKKIGAIKSDLTELLEIGIINFENKENKFIINGLVFYRFCTEILNLTIY